MLQDGNCHSVPDMNCQKILGFLYGPFKSTKSERVTGQVTLLEEVLGIPAEANRIFPSF